MVGLFLWITATSFYFLFNSIGFALSPIAEDGLISLLTIYIPVLFLTVFLLIYLTRKREQVDWAKLYVVDKESAKKEAWLCLIYLIITQLILGVGFNMGLHFPGTDTYSSGSHSQQDVLIWLIIYTIIPIFWLQRKGLSIGKLFTSFK